MADAILGTVGTFLSLATSWYKNAAARGTASATFDNHYRNFRRFHEHIREPIQALFELHERRRNPILLCQAVRILHLLSDLHAWLTEAGFYKADKSVVVFVARRNGSSVASQGHLERRQQRGHGQLVHPWFGLTGKEVAFITLFERIRLAYERLEDQYPLEAYGFVADRVEVSRQTMPCIQARTNLMRRLYSRCFDTCMSRKDAVGSEEVTTLILMGKPTRRARQSVKILFMVSSTGIQSPKDTTISSTQGFKGGGISMLKGSNKGRRTTPIPTTDLLTKISTTTLATDRDATLLRKHHCPRTFPLPCPCHHPYQCPCPQELRHSQADPSTSLNGKSSEKMKVRAPQLPSPCLPKTQPHLASHNHNHTHTHTKNSAPKPNRTSRKRHITNDALQRRREETPQAPPAEGSSRRGPQERFERAAARRRTARRAESPR